jgi:hypothetical protein
MDRDIETLLEPVVFKKDTDGTRRGIKVPFLMSKGEISKEQALRLVAYTITLTNFVPCRTEVLGLMESTIAYLKVQLAAALEAQVSKNQASAKL